jgi:sulfate adenylyltransferase subunit 1
MLCWMNQRELQLNSKFHVRHTTKDVRGVLKEIQYKLDINTLQRVEQVDRLTMNEIARVSYRKNRITGSIILVDEATNETVAAGMIV